MERSEYPKVFEGPAGRETTWLRRDSYIGPPCRDVTECDVSNDEGKRRYRDALKHPDAFKHRISTVARGPITDWPHPRLSPLIIIVPRYYPCVFCYGSENSFGWVVVDGVTSCYDCAMGVLGRRLSRKKPSTGRPKWPSLISRVEWAQTSIETRKQLFEAKYIGTYRDFRKYQVKTGGVSFTDPHW